jgi:kynurenine formamidase
MHAQRPERTPNAQRAGDIVIVNTGWHHTYADSAEY